MRHSLFSNSSFNNFSHCYFQKYSVLALLLFMSGCASQQNVAEVNEVPVGTDKSIAQKKTENQQRPLTAMEEKWGIRIVGLRSTMAGMMVDFRYTVVDPNKAAPLLDINNKAIMVVEKNNAKLGVPNSVKIGALRQTTHAKKVKPGRDYFILFGNPGNKWVKVGDKVTVVIGDFKAEGLVLQ